MGTAVLSYIHLLVYHLNKGDHTGHYKRTDCSSLRLGSFKNSNEKTSSVIIDRILLSERSLYHEAISSFTESIIINVPFEGVSLCCCNQLQWSTRWLF